MKAKINLAKDQSLLLKNGRILDITNGKIVSKDTWYQCDKYNTQMKHCVGSGEKIIVKKGIKLFRWIFSSYFLINSPCSLFSWSRNFGAIVNRSQPANSFISSTFLKLAPITSVLNPFSLK